MTIKDYLNDKVVFLGINIIMFLFLGGIILYSEMNFIFMVYTFLIWFVPLIIYIILDYLRYKKYFKSIYNILEKLDKKYLLPEVIDDVNFAIGEELNYILKVISRDMHENIKIYKDNEEEYREYIETWVHEIKTPIASSKLIIENNNNEVTRKIDRQIEKIEDFVEQVLYYSKSDNVEKDYVIRQVNLKQVVTNVIKRNSKDFINEKIKLELNDIDNIVYSDAKWIEFIINQIITNAIKYRKLKDATICITSKIVGNSVVLCIKDNGIRIDEKDINRVFDKGFIGSNGRKRKRSTGIGLYICKKLCDRLGLVLTIESEVNVYTYVKIKFPIFFDNRDVVEMRKIHFHVKEETL